MSSGPVQPGRYGATLYSYPTTGSFAADRAPIVGNTSSAAAVLATGFEGLLLAPDHDHYTTQSVQLDGQDHTRVLYGANTVTVPIAVVADNAHDALVERRRIIAAFEARHRRAALEVWDPASSGQSSRWLTSLIYRAASDVQPFSNDRQSWFEFRIQFETIGQPFWTPEPIAANEVTGRIVPTTPGAVNQLFITNPGDHGAWPRIDVNGLNLDATVSVTLAADTSLQVDLIDVGSGNTGIDFDQRLRAITDGTRVSAASIYFQIPPGDHRLDIIVTGPVGGNSWVDVSFLPAYSTV